jgi:transposase-like protein
MSEAWYIVCALISALVMLMIERHEGQRPCDHTFGAWVVCVVMAALWPVVMPIVLVYKGLPVLTKERTLRKEIKRLRMEREILKRAAVFFAKESS